MIPTSLYSIDLEQAFLGAVLRNNTPIATLDIKPTNFFHPDHAEIYQEILRQYHEKGAVSWPEMTLFAQGRTFRQNDDGVAYLKELHDGAVTALEQGIKHYSAQIIELYRKRELYEAAIELQISLEKKTSSECLNEFTGAVTSEINSITIKSCESVRQEIISSLEMPLECVSTGLRCLDEAMAGGMYRKFTYGLCGAEKSGKTTFAHTISYNIGQRGVKHLYVALEMGSFQIEQKNIAREHGFNALAFLERRGAVKDKIKGIELKSGRYYLDAPGMDLQDILHHVSVAIAKYGIDGFIIDYWQLVQGQQRGESEEKHLRNVAQGFADFARKNNVWCLLLAQMNKDGQLFGGNGLRKACDQLYMIEQYEEQARKSERWLRMDASRYTIRGDVGSPEHPALFIDNLKGPYFTEWADDKA